MKRKKEAIRVTFIVIASLIVVAKALCMVVSYLSTPKSFVPMDHIKCADSIVRLVLTHGFPDEVNKDTYDIDGRVRLIYKNKEIIGKNTDCEYEFAFGLFDLTGNLVCINYSTAYDGYDRDEYFERTVKYLNENDIGEWFTANEEPSDAIGGKSIRYSWKQGAVGEYIDIDAYDDCGRLRIEWLY